MLDDTTIGREPTATGFDDALLSSPDAAAGAAARTDARPAPRQGDAGAGDHGAGAPAAPRLAKTRPASRPRRRGRAFALFLLVCLTAVCALLGVRYGVPRKAVGLSVARGTMVVQRNGPGTLDAINRSAVSARVQGRLTAIPVDLNDRVAAGDVVAEIASDDLKSQLRATVASHEAARVAVLKAKAEEEQRRAEVANAETTFRRQAKLVEKGATSQAGYDEAEAAMRTARARLAAAEAAVGQAEAQQRSAAATVEHDRARLDETTVRSLFDGVVVARQQNIGDLATPGSPIVEIVDPATIVLKARFDESAIASVKPGQKADLSFVSQPGRIIPGHVLRISRQVDAETREFTVDIVPEDLPRNWAIGQRGTAVIAIAVKSDVISVPSRHILRRRGEAGVWTVAGGRASWVPVELGEIGGDLVEIRAGLRDGDIVLSRGRIFQGMRVRGIGGAP
ncbi:HlyD family secretion protein [Rhodobium orientis]|nr:efflux RND transporter periplasmic adaptor subunit [Rhodobium orientis]MBB4303979.1 HlyD family secretion protein [Rhodobium orientis]